MTTTKKSIVPVWIFFVVALGFLLLEIKITDAILICYLYGRDAYFVQGLRIIHTRPTLSLSSGVKLSEKATSIEFWTSGFIWMLSSSFCLVAIEKIFTVYRNSKTGA